MHSPTESDLPEPPPAADGAALPSPEEHGEAPLWDGHPVWVEHEPAPPAGPVYAGLSEEGLYPSAELTYPVSAGDEQDAAPDEEQVVAPGFEYAAPYEEGSAQIPPPEYEYLAPVEEGNALPAGFEFSAPSAAEPFPVLEPEAVPFPEEDFAAYEIGYAVPPELPAEASAPAYLTAAEPSPLAPQPPSGHLPPGVPDDQVALLCEGLERFLGAAEARVHVLRGVSLRLEPGYVHAVVGPSGCGKSSLLYILGLLDRPDAGRLVISGRPVANLDDDDLSRQRNFLLGFIFQFHFLLQDFTAQENIMIPMRQLGLLTEAQMRDRASYLLDAVGLGDKGHRASRHLSGGEQQRVAIARALANDPQVILADEPTGNLDTANSTRVFSLLTDLVHRENKALLLVTHNPAIAEACDWVHTMRDGLIVDQQYVGARR